MKKYRFGICGHFGGKKEFIDGQTIKTKTWKLALEEKTGEIVEYIDTYKWNSKKIKLIKDCINLSRKCDNVIILPARPGVNVLLPIFVFLKLFFRFKLSYIVIGGWIPEHLKKYKYLHKAIKFVDGVYVESYSTLSNLKDMDISNVHYLPNFKYLDPLKKEEINYDLANPYRVCILSRILKEKGIEDAIDVIKTINNEVGKIKYTLDIYGPIDDKYKEDFEGMIKDFPVYIQYKGSIDPTETVRILKDYFLLLFPTRYPGEGLPGTILDAYASGLPVLASSWNSYKDIIEEGKTGLIFKLGDIQEMKLRMEEIYQDPTSVLQMKKQCLDKYTEYSRHTVVENFLSTLGEN